MTDKMGSMQSFDLKVKGQTSRDRQQITNTTTRSRQRQSGSNPHHHHRRRRRGLSLIKQRSEN